MPLITRSQINFTYKDAYISPTTYKIVYFDKITFVNSLSYKIPKPTDILL